MLGDLASEEDLFFLLSERERAERRHAELANHLPRELGGLFDIVACAGCHGPQEQLFRKTATHHDRKLAFQISARIRVAIVHRQLLGHAQGHAAWNDRDFVQRVCAFDHRRNHSVSGFVISGHALLVFADDQRFSCHPHQHFILRHFEVILHDARVE